MFLLAVKFTIGLAKPLHRHQNYMILYTNGKRITEKRLPIFLAGWNKIRKSHLVSKRVCSFFVLSGIIKMPQSPIHCLSLHAFAHHHQYIQHKPQITLFSLFIIASQNRRQRRWQHRQNQLILKQCFLLCQKNSSANSQNN